MAWLSLDAADNEPASFWTYVVTALQGAVPGVGASALELLASSPVPTELVLTTLLNELAAAPGEVWLVLDDYHLVDNHEVNEGVAFLLEHLPAQVHVVISTRADPDLPLARWRVRGELVEIRAADLRFTSDEANAYLNVATGLDLAAADVAVLEERTEGWIAALQLAALSLQGREDVSGFIARFAGDDRYIVDYLIEEVLRHQPDAVRGFLLQSAVLDRLTGPLCDAVTGRDDGSEMLVALERANLFIVALDDRREWYRYHHLFADVLRARMLSEQPDQVSLLHQRASRLVRAPRSDRGGGQARAGCARLRPGGPPDRAGHAGDPTPPAGSDDVRLAEGAARRHRPAQPGAQCLLRRHADGTPATSTRSNPGSTTRNARWLPFPTGRLSPGLTPQSSGRCRRPSPSIGPRSPRPGAMRPARRNTPGAPWTWPVRTIISRAAARPGSSASPPGPRATCPARWRRSRRRWPACTPPATSSTS